METNLREKLEILNLPAEEEKKVVEKFLATLSLVEVKELKESVNYLKDLGIEIAKANHVKIFANTLEELKKKVNILTEIHELDMYREDPSRINCNVLDVNKKIQYCKQIGTSYKKEDGTYEKFLFDEQLWHEFLENETKKKDDRGIDIQNLKNNNGVKEEPLNNVMNFNEYRIGKEDSSDVNKDTSDNNVISLDAYKAIKDAKEIENKKNSFDDVRNSLEGLKKELNDLNFDYNSGEKVGINDIPFGEEDYNIGMGRAA